MRSKIKFTSNIDQFDQDLTNLEMKFDKLSDDLTDSSIKLTQLRTWCSIKGFVLHRIARTKNANIQNEMNLC